MIDDGLWMGGWAGRQTDRERQSDSQPLKSVCLSKSSKRTMIGLRSHCRLHVEEEWVTVQFSRLETATLQH